MAYILHAELHIWKSCPNPGFVWMGRTFRTLPVFNSMKLCYILSQTEIISEDMSNTLWKLWKTFCALNHIRNALLYFWVTSHPKTWWLPINHLLLLMYLRVSWRSTDLNIPLTKENHIVISVGKCTPSIVACEANICWITFQTITDR